MDRGQWDLRKACKAEVMSLSALLQCAVAAAPHTPSFITQPTIPPTLLYCFSLSLLSLSPYPMAAQPSLRSFISWKGSPFASFMSSRFGCMLWFCLHGSHFLFCFFRRRRLRLHFAPFRPGDARGNCCPRFSINLPELLQQLYNTLHYIKKREKREKKRDTLRGWY